MNRLSFIVILLLVCIPVRAEFADSLASNFRVPAFDFSVKTPAPKGYRPVYISHYGRHGARFLSNPKEYLRVLEPLAEADSCGNLTETGKAFYEDCRNFYITYAKDREGELTPIGWKQHHNIANQLFDNYRQIFRRHPEVIAKSTHYQRCIVSMSSFCLALAQKDPKLSFYTESNGRDYPILLNDKAAYEPVLPGWDYSQSSYLSSLDPMPVLERIFKDTTKVENPHKLASYIYAFVKSTGCVNPDIDLSKDVMTGEDMLPYYKGDALHFYERCGIRKKRMASVVQGIIDDADADLTKAVPPVRLRFGHDIVQELSWRSLILTVSALFRPAQQKLTKCSLSAAFQWHAPSSSFSIKIKAAAHLLRFCSTVRRLTCPSLQYKGRSMIGKPSNHISNPLHDEQRTDPFCICTAIHLLRAGLHRLA